MSGEFQNSPEARKEELKQLVEEITRLQARILGLRKDGNVGAEEETQLQVNALKAKRFEMLDDSERQEVFVENVTKNTASYQECSEMGMPIDLGMIMFDAFGEPTVEIGDPLKAKMLEHLDSFEWWREREDYGE